MNFLKNIFFPQLKRDEEFYMNIKKIIGFKPNDISIYLEAFTHRSMNLKSQKGHAKNYERLEFLGDAILGTIIALHLFKEAPNGNEGYLTKMRAKIVSREHLNELGKDLKLTDYVKTNIPTKQFGENIHGNIFESLIGAIYLDKGYSFCEQFIRKRVIIPYVDIKKLEGKITSYKSLFIEWCQKHKKHFNFNVYEDTGKESLRHFAVKLELEKSVIAKARGTSKKKAEEKAAKRAYYKLKEQIKI